MQGTIVVKIGSSSLTSDEGGLNRDSIAFFASELARLQREGNRVLLVTSGAVAAGFRAMGYTVRPKLLHEKQASASVGQALLMQAYQAAFAEYGVGIGQILLTRSDFSNRRRIQNAQSTIEELLRRGILPVVNENDTVAVDELKFGDNDTLSALVANLVRARRLLILTDTDGLYTEDPRRNPEAKRIDRVTEIDEHIYRIAGGSGSMVGTGGMRSKIEAARIAMRGGVPCFVGRVTEPGDLLQAAGGTGRGTYFDTSEHNLPMKKQWLGFHSQPKGLVTVDEGAESALVSGGRSLLPAGVREVAGEFHPGDVIEVAGVNGQIIGRGVVNYESWQLQAVAGLGSDEVQRRIEVPRIEVIHRDEWITLAQSLRTKDTAQ
ncbi:glutamate 5-kinase [Paenibacillus mucilaginosus]|uniref:Glutamate 5-kinase n=2 Tax=Paenibacillus mucilaginosus TaxID=61624 RepID=I0BQ17_9BACL|nr:glutamate 5-kinase [Paenibacillus mucilaginosus]AEI42554.1 glutamate 5-kinase [Paenibacillus mucilaginosus KNP414]AFH64464.2 gamma-glutamyl kinase [Paenibacillus mucilaginosus K02]MCG7213946.1 glutamate 5-kinase [Paenibacillus mucilaginosus]WDM25949.1 glutamate 5-kinase [Paenibacillus mucilaginosus]WFA20600.1 glutamate 5-kinase [Paenibacillus mucilaginosus]